MGKAPEKIANKAKVSCTRMCMTKSTSPAFTIAATVATVTSLFSSYACRGVGSKNQKPRVAVARVRTVVRRGREFARFA